LVSVAPVLSALGINSAIAETGDAHNAYWWKSLNVSEKSIYVLGFAEGSAIADSNWAEIQRRSKTKLPNSSAIQDGDDYSGVRVGQVVDGLDEFYKDFLNAQIHVRDAIYIVKERAKRTNPKMFEELTQGLRQLAAKPGDE
jgi:hypothetical protein